MPRSPFDTGVPIVSVLDTNTLLSILRGRAGALFASTPEELVTAAAALPAPSDQNDFFTLDPQLRR